MEIKKWEERKMELKKSATIALQQIEDSGQAMPFEEDKFNQILKNIDSYVKSKVIDVANAVANIKDVGLDVREPVVQKWALEELNLSPQQFGDFLKSTASGEEAKFKILKKMDVPTEIMEELSTKAKKTK